MSRFLPPGWLDPALYAFSNSSKMMCFSSTVGGRLKASQ
jgi:hypothetical protein